MLLVHIDAHSLCRARQWSVRRQRISSYADGVRSENKRDLNSRTSEDFYVSDTTEIGRVLKGDKGAAIVLYCNGPFCGKSKRLAAELLEAGYTNVRRYQLGIPIWRALGGVTQIEPAGIQHVVENDRTAVFIDVRDAAEFKGGSVASAKNVPRNLVKEGKDVGEVKAAKDDGRLPMEDHNARIIVFGKTAEEARAVAQAIANEAFHNVSFFDGSFEQFRSSVAGTGGSP